MDLIRRFSLPLNSSLSRFQQMPNLMHAFTLAAIATIPTLLHHCIHPVIFKPVRPHRLALRHTDPATVTAQESHPPVPFVGYTLPV
jgi:hypothetical protein